MSFAAANFPFDDMPLSISLDLDDKFNGWIDDMKCIGDVFDRELINQKKEVWERLTPNYNDIFVQWEECSNINDIAEQLK